MNVSGYVGHVTIIYLNVHYCVLFSSTFRVRIRVRIRFSVWFCMLLCTRICAILGCNCHAAAGNSFCLAVRRR